MHFSCRSFNKAIFVYRGNMSRKTLRRSGGAALEEASTISQAADK